MKHYKPLAILAIVLLFAVSCCDCPSGTPENIISKTEADLLKKTYNEYQYEFINLGLKEKFETSQKDNNAVLFTDIDDLQKFLQQVKERSKENGDEASAVAVVLGAKKNENGVPLTTLYFQGAGVPKGATRPYDFTDYKLKFIPGSYADKGHPIIVKKDSIGGEPKNLNQE